MDDPEPTAVDRDRRARFSCRGPLFSRREAMAATSAAIIGPYFLSCTRSRPSAPPLAEPLYYSSATALASAIRSRTLSSEEVVRSFIARTTEVNPKINAVVRLADDALAVARRADQAIARGERLGALHGVPMTIKDSIETSGVVTTAGTSRDLSTKSLEHIEKQVEILRRVAAAYPIGSAEESALRLAAFALLFVAMDHFDEFEVLP